MQDQRTLEKPARLTERKALALPLPQSGYLLHWCGQTPGFGVRVTAAGARSWIAERRVNGKTVRRTLGRVTGRGAISPDAARKLMLEVSGELQRGVDRLEEQRAERAERNRVDEETALTFREALTDYLKRKRRSKDGLPLKESTKKDYLAMVRTGRVTKDGKQLADGELIELAETPLSHLTADDMHRAFKTASARGVRRGAYAMQVLRAVLNWHGVNVPGNPLGKEVAGKDRIVLPKPVGDPKPIAPERLAAWWKAASAREGQESADYCRVLLLTGLRPGELGTAEVRDFDASGARLTLRDTKNRTDHTVLLSRQALAIVAAHAKGKKASDGLFSVVDVRKTLAAINATAETAVKPHGLRSTFASVAEELVSAYTLKRMLNHADSGDVTGAHYVGKSEAQLRAAWQTVADFVVKARDSKRTAHRKSQPAMESSRGH
jgi:integrase